MLKPTDVVFDGIDTRDAPDFCDAFICEAFHPDGRPYTEEELDALNDDRDLVYDLLMDYLY